MEHQRHAVTRGPHVRLDIAVAEPAGRVKGGEDVLAPTLPTPVSEGYRRRAVEEGVSQR